MSPKILKNQQVNVVYGQNHCPDVPTRPINALYGQNLELLNVRPLGS